MNDSSQAPKKPKPKPQQKIYRRKNEQIPKQFQCPVQSCGKAYGSYAALYTHIKNKHNNIKPPTMPTSNPSATKPKNSHPGRPKIKKDQQQQNQERNKQEENSVMEINNDQIMCKLCMQLQCQCVDSFDDQEKKKVIQIMGCEKFTSFTNQIGMLGIDDINWVRRTQQQYTYKSQQQIIKQIHNFNQKYNLQSNPSQKLIQYLSFSSKYWQQQNIDQLYNTIYAMIAFQNHQLCVKFILENDGQFGNMANCVRNNGGSFKRLESIVRVI